MTDSAAAIIARSIEKVALSQSGFNLNTVVAPLLTFLLALIVANLQLKKGYRNALALAGKQTRLEAYTRWQTLFFETVAGIRNGLTFMTADLAATMKGRVINTTSPAAAAYFDRHMALMEELGRHTAMLTLITEDRSRKEAELNRKLAALVTELTAIQASLPAQDKQREAMAARIKQVSNEIAEITDLCKEIAKDRFDSMVPVEEEEK